MKKPEQSNVGDEIIKWKTTRVRAKVGKILTIDELDNEGLWFSRK